MCTRPNMIWVERGPGHVEQVVPCRSCWQCRKNHVNDFVGRCLAEASVSDWVQFWTLTYAPRDDLAEKILTPRHFQDFVRSLRKRGYNVRYLACGEYGERKGRAHFHCILFGKGRMAQVPLNVRSHHDAWPHGHVMVKNGADEGAIRYVCKYLLKESEQTWFTCSKKPPLGDAFFDRLAQRNVEMDTLPTTFQYKAPGGGAWRYPISGASRRIYIQRILDGMGDRFNFERCSQWCAAAVEKVKRYEADKSVVYDMGSFIDQLAEELGRRKMTERERLAYWMRETVHAHRRRVEHWVQIQEWERKGYDVTAIKRAAGLPVAVSEEEGCEAASRDYEAGASVYERSRAGLREGDHSGIATWAEDFW